MRCRQCQSENRAGIRFCEECGNRLALACPRCDADVLPDKRFCGSCGTQVATESTGRYASPDAYTPKHLADKILRARSAIEGERKQVTVLFADLKGSLELLANRDPEEARELLDPVLKQMMEAVHYYEGTVNQVMGDGIMALFGAPIAHEDHAVRACLAALRMQDGMSRLTMPQAVPLQIRVGLNSGEVVVGSIGSDLHMEYTAVGQTTHLAAQMEQNARPGRVLITTQTARLAEGYVQTLPLGPVSVKGLGAPVDIHEIVGIGPAHSRLEAATARGLTPFVGREAEILALEHALLKARAGRGQIVAVVGEPGVGKSRLFWEFTHSARTEGCLLLESRSVSYGKATPCAPIIDVLKLYFQIGARDEARTIEDKVSGRLLALDPALHAVLPPLLSLLDAPISDPRWRDLDPLERKDQTFEAVKRLLLRKSQVQPVCLVFEDLHWVDAETEALLDRLIDGLPATRVLLLVNYRTEYRHGWGSKSYYSQIRIDPLPAASVAEFLQSLVGNDTGLDALKEMLIERTDGNPFFLEENVRDLVETKVLEGERGSHRLSRPLAAIRVPATVQAVLAARIDRLPSESKRLLQSAAVIGKDVSFPLLQAVMEESADRLDDRLKHLQAAEFLYETSLIPVRAYTFKHALTHEVAYSSLLNDRRTALHAHVALAIGRVYHDRVAEHAEAIARHALRGEVWDVAVDSLRETAAKAFARAAFPEAVERYEQALEVLPRLPTTTENIRRAIDVRLDLHVPLYTLGQVPRLVQLHQEAEELARRLDDQSRLGRVIMRMGVYSFFNAEYAQGIDYARRAVDIAAATNDAELSILASHALGMNHFWRGDYTAAAECFAWVVEGPHVQLAKHRLGLAFGSPYLLGSCFLTWCLALLGDFARGLELGHRAVQTADSSGQPQAQAAAYAYLGIALALKGDFAEALRWADQAAGLCETKQILVWLPTTYLARGWALAWCGQMADGLAYLEQATSMSEGLGVKATLSQYHLRWGQALLLGGKLPDASRAARRALEAAGTAGERGTEAEAHLLLGEIAAAKDPPRPEDALGCYLQAQALADELGMLPISARCHLALGRLRSSLKDRDAAAADLAVAARLFRNMNMQYWLLKATEEASRLA